MRTIQNRMTLHVGFVLPLSWRPRFGQQKNRLRVLRIFPITTQKLGWSFQCSTENRKVKTRLREPASWLPLATGASSRNLVFTF